MTLCERTVPARDVSGTVDENVMCLSCIRVMGIMLRADGWVPPDKALRESFAEQIGLDAIV